MRNRFRPQYPDETVAAVKALRVAGKTVAEIAKATGLCRETVYSYLSGKCRNEVRVPGDEGIAFHPNKGSHHPMAKLNESRVRDIRDMLGMGFKGVDIAELEQVSPAQVSNIKHGRYWPHVI